MSPLENPLGPFQLTILLLGRTEGIEISDYQIIDVLNDHLCYVVTDKRTPWHLPFKRSFRLVSKVVITFVSKSKSKLAIYTKVEWLWRPYGLQGESFFFFFFVCLLGLNRC